jgi:hypothetical protein
LPLEFNTDQGKEFTNKMATHLFDSLLKVQHATTASYHPGNSQAEVCNKTIAQYLATAVNEAATDWEPFVTTLAFAYNTSFQRSIKATLFSLTYGIEAQLPLFFAPNFKWLPGDNDNLLAPLQHAR